MQEIKENEILVFYNNYKTFNEETLCYWYNRVNHRLDYLKPLLIELENKQLKLDTFSKTLFNEVSNLNDIIMLLELFKK